MLRIFDRAIDIGEKLKEAGVVEIKVLEDRYILYGRNTEILDVIVNGAYKVIQAFLITQGKNQIGKIFCVDVVLDNTYKARSLEVNHTIQMVKGCIGPYIKDDCYKQALAVLDRELRNRL